MKNNQFFRYAFIGAYYFFQKYKLYFRFLKILCSPSRCPLNLPRTEDLSVNKYAAFSNYPAERNTGSLSIPATLRRNTKREGRVVDILAVSGWVEPMTRNGPRALVSF
jgi:hypothetical protein